MLSTDALLKVMSTHTTDRKQSKKVEKKKSEKDGPKWVRRKGTRLWRHNFYASKIHTEVRKTMTSNLERFFRFSGGKTEKIANLKSETESPSRVSNLRCGAMRKNVIGAVTAGRTKNHKHAILFPLEITKKSKRTNGNRSFSSIQKYSEIGKENKSGKLLFSCKDITKNNKTRSRQQQRETFNSNWERNKTIWIRLFRFMNCRRIKLNIFSASLNSSASP